MKHEQKPMSCTNLYDRIAMIHSENNNNKYPCIKSTFKQIQVYLDKNPKLDITDQYGRWTGKVLFVVCILPDNSKSILHYEQLTKLCGRRVIFSFKNIVPVPGEFYYLIIAPPLTDRKYVTADVRSNNGILNLDDYKKSHGIVDIKATPEELIAAEITMEDLMSI